MAKINKGILGGFSGKVGNVIGGSWKGIDYMRSKPNKVKDPKTEAQLAQRQKFAMVGTFLRKIQPLIRLGFKTNTKRMSSINSAMSYNLKNAISGDYPNLQLDFPSVLIARGDLIPAQHAEATSSEIQKVSLSWTDNSGTGSAKADDKMLALVYHPATESAVYSVGNDAERQDESFTFDLPESFGGDTVETYLAFVSADEKEASDSQYLGSISIL